MLIDLTLPAQGQQEGRETVRVEERPHELAGGGGVYTGVVYHFAHDSMLGSYIDFPGHIKETDDGLDSATYPIGKLYRVPATVIRMSRADGSGGVKADELAAACPKPFRGEALVLNALGNLRFDEIVERTVWLEKDAVQWIVDRGIHLLVSDVYESQEVHGVFGDLFAGHVSTVCYPIHLNRLTQPYTTLTVLPIRFPGVTQLPCRILAEVEN